MGSTLHDLYNCRIVENCMKEALCILEMHVLNISNWYFSIFVIAHIRSLLANLVTNDD